MQRLACRDGGAPCIPACVQLKLDFKFNATLRLRRTDLTDVFLPALGVAPTFVELPDGRDGPAV